MIPRIMIAVWSFVIAMLLQRLIVGDVDFVFTCLLLILAIFMWIYNVADVIITDFPTKITINVQTPNKKNENAQG